MRREAIIECNKIAVPATSRRGSRNSTASERPDDVVRVMTSPGATTGRVLRLDRPMAMKNRLFVVRIFFEGQYDDLIVGRESQVVGCFAVDRNATLARFA